MTNKQLIKFVEDTPLNDNGIKVVYLDFDPNDEQDKILYDLSEKYPIHVFKGDENPGPEKLNELSESALKMSPGSGTINSIEAQGDGFDIRISSFEPRKPE